ncbi:hypothetical protein GCM10010124_20670 [Pilimelia terevasa]|uniref:DUF2631 domain-containing protein n=1 Tax=Pilimelia terevasa TaxID=53372 RepID=A0A8J3BNT3_9ACTN|nr:hypothetical protein GCM10010124_20670 [Pilimelia terevasa]
MAGNAPVTAPDQHKPTNRKWLRIGAVVSAAIIVLMAAFGNHEGRVENYVSYVIAGLMVLAVVVDAAMHRAGLRD